MSGGQAQAPAGPLAPLNRRAGVFSLHRPHVKATMVLMNRFLDNVLVLTILVCLSAAGPALAAAAPTDAAPEAAPAEPAQPSVFDLPALQAAYARTNMAVAALFARGEFPQAEALLRKAVAALPFDAAARYNLACALAEQGKKDEALAELAKSVDLGFRDAKHIEDDKDLVSLHPDPRYAAAVKKAGEPLTQPVEGWKYTVKPAEQQDGQVMVSEANTAWDGRLGVFRVLFKLERSATADKPVCVGYGQAGELLRGWYQEGAAAGNHGDVYDNHDGDHSNMCYDTFPQITRIEFSDEAKKRGLHHGLNLHMFYNAITLGNSSTAITGGPFWRSQPRHALTQPNGVALLYLQYVGNHLYFYPEHRDHDPGHNGTEVTPEGQKKESGHGDVYPANTPYMIISQGSSGSDRPFMDAAAATLAAFRPEVKAELAKAGVLMPTLQMIFRMSNKMVAQPDDYLTGKAHPTVFEGGQLDVAKMVTMAHNMTPDVLPPMVQLKVVDEDETVVGRDYFDFAARERLCDTPCAIARVVKATKYARRMLVTAEASKDLQGKPLTFHWAVLRGDGDAIKINKLNDSGSQVELLVPYHERRPITPGSAIESNRVDIGAFVNNGTYYSAPAFISFFYLDNQKRVYDAQHRIMSVDYADPQVKDNYVDPVLDLPKDWRDEYHYAPAPGSDGALTGWTRVRGSAKESFTADGQLIVKTDDAGKPVQTAAVRYVPKRLADGSVVLEEQVAQAKQE
jgi:hypothetical protein